ncbi:MAG: ribosome-associated translation inhibitor RaiA [Campylobacterales bacterium]|nr:ribosome-associated translation inhibitor RaiA [Campylobacterales bacterium]
MNISFVGRHIELTDTIKDHLHASIASLEKFNLDIISVSAIASLEERKGKHGVSIEFTINLAGKNTIVIKQRDDDLYAAIDVAIERVQKALRRHNDRINDHKGESINEIKNATLGAVDLSLAQESMEDEIVPVELDLYKPQEVADVLENLKESEKIFEIFIDHDGKTRVLYKRKDGRFGLF